MKIENLKGFTVIEIIVAIFILIIGIVAVLQMFPLGIQTERTARMATVAGQLGQAKIEEIISKSYDEISVGVEEEDYGSIPDFNSYKRKTEVNFFDPDNPSIPPGSDLGIKKIKVTVFWKSPPGVSEKSIKIATLIAER